MNTIVIGTINHSDIGVINQLSYRLGAPLCSTTCLPGIPGRDRIPWLSVKGPSNGARRHRSAAVAEVPDTTPTVFHPASLAVAVHIKPKGAQKIRAHSYVHKYIYIERERETYHTYNCKIYILCMSMVGFDDVFPCRYSQFWFGTALPSKPPLMQRHPWRHWWKGGMATPNVTKSWTQKWIGKLSFAVLKHPIWAAFFFWAIPTQMMKVPNIKSKASPVQNVLTVVHALPVSSVSVAICKSLSRGKLPLLMPGAKGADRNSWSTGISPEMAWLSLYPAW